MPTLPFLRNERSSVVTLPGGTHSQLHVEAAERDQSVMGQFAQRLR